MRKFNSRYASLALTFVASLGGTGAAFAQEASVTGIEQNTTIDCDGRDASVSGTDHIVRIEGNCTKLEVSGINNKVRVSMAPGGVITVSGTDNVVEWTSTGKPPRRSVSGIDNRVVPAR